MKTLVSFFLLVLTAASAISFTNVVDQDIITPGENMKNSAISLPCCIQINQKQVIYKCPMHPEVKADKPGKCPKCGMNLVEGQEAKNAKVAAYVYTCPMHKEVMQDKAGKCPKCGMNLVKTELEKVIYTCPMHPEIKQDKPGKCSKCGMDLVKSEAPSTKKSEEDK